MKGYVSISIPNELIDEIDKIIEKKPNWGYKSRAEFIKEAIRNLISDRK